MGFSMLNARKGWFGNNLLIIIKVIKGKIYIWRKYASITMLCLITNRALSKSQRKNFRWTLKFIIIIWDSLKRSIKLIIFEELANHKFTT